MTHHETDYSKHSDDELRDAIRKSKENLARIKSEGSDDALQAAKDQHEAMERELATRQS